MRRKTGRDANGVFSQKQNYILFYLSSRKSKLPKNWIEFLNYESWLSKYIADTLTLTVNISFNQLHAHFYMHTHIWRWTATFTNWEIFSSIHLINWSLTSLKNWPDSDVVSSKKKIVCMYYFICRKSDKLHTNYAEFLNHDDHDWTYRNIGEQNCILLILPTRKYELGKNSF